MSGAGRRGTGRWSARRANNFFGYGLRVAPDGTAMAVWRADDSGGTLTYYSSVRPPGGAWGTPQVIVADDDGHLRRQFAISDTGAAIASWGDTSPAGIWTSTRPAGGVWGAPEQITAVSNQHAVAMSATGDAVVVYRAPAPGDAFARYRPAGGSWGASQLVLDSTVLRPDAGADGRVRRHRTRRRGRGLREFNDTIRVNVARRRRWRGLGRRPTRSSTTTAIRRSANPPPAYDLRNLHALVRHPQGASRSGRAGRPRRTSNYDIVVSRLSGASWDTPKASMSRTVSTARRRRPTPPARVLLAVTRDGSTGQDIYASIAPSLSGGLAGPDAGFARRAGTKQYRTPVAGGGGNAFYVAWSVHGAGDGTEIIIDEAARDRAAGRPTPTPTPTPTATPRPSRATPTATADPAPQPLPAPPTPSATPDPRSSPPRPERDRRLHDRCPRPPSASATASSPCASRSPRRATRSRRSRCA